MFFRLLIIVAEKFRVSLNGLDVFKLSFECWFVEVFVMFTAVRHLSSIGGISSIARVTSRPRGP